VKGKSEQLKTKTSFLKCVIYLLQQQGHTIHGSKYVEVINKNTETNSNKFKQAWNSSVQLDECIDRMALETVFVGYPY
jgi:hypothetical protein